jgi:hypothetical protein
VHETQRTRWDLELGRKRDLLADLDDAALADVIQEALEVQHEHGRQRVDRDLLARVEHRTWPRRRHDLHGLRLRERRKCVADRVHRVLLRARGMRDVRARGVDRSEKDALTWMSSCSERQSSTTTESRWPGTRSVERNLPPKTRVIGDSTPLTCTHSVLSVMCTAGREK